MSRSERRGTGSDPEDSLAPTVVGLRELPQREHHRDMGSIRAVLSPVLVT